jgi:hypothetical protein
MSLFFAMNITGDTFRPCPTVSRDDPLPPDEYVMIENPAVALALTVEVMEPAVFVTVELPASQAQATYVELLPLTSAVLPTENPFELKAVSV